MKWKLALTSALLLTIAPLAAQDSTLATTDAASSKMLIKAQAITITGLSAFKTKIKDANQTQLTYGQAQGTLASVNFLEDDNTPVSLFDIGIKVSHLSWEGNPYFKNSAIYNPVFEAAHTFDFDLPFNVRAEGHLETTRTLFGQVNLYGIYNLKGKKLSFGLYKELGRRSEVILPILGIKMPLFEKMELDVLLPFYAQVSYSPIDSTKLYVAARSLSDRQRMHDAYWSYQANTVALGVNYSHMKMLQMGIEAGQALNPSVRTLSLTGEKLATLHAKNSTFVEFSLNVLF